MARLLRSALLTRVGGLVHGFSTRDPDLGALLPHPSAWPPSWPVEGPWEPLFQALAPDRPRPLVAAAVHQVHGRDVEVLRSPPTANPVARADALVTSLPGVVLTIRTADCVPILLAGPGVIGAVHAGWRGTVQDIVGQAVLAMAALASCGPDQIRAAIGPAICGDCYEVGPEVVEAVRAVLPAGTGLREGPGERPHVDLAAVNRALLLRAGVVEVEALARCTFHEPQLFHSYRREGGHAGRQVAAIARM